MRLDDDALRTDLLLDELLGPDRSSRDGARARVGGAPDHGRWASGGGGERDDPLRRTAEVVDRLLIRFHPSFRFEEQLATTLRAAARGSSTGISASSGELTVLPGITPVSAGDPSDPRARGWLVGGAIASGVSLVGVALFARWRGRPGRQRLI